MLKAIARTAIAVVLVGLAAPAAYADGPGGGICDTSGLMVTVCASDGGSSGADDQAAPVDSAQGGEPDADAADDDGGGKSDAEQCTYKKAQPQPPAENRAWEGKTPTDGAVYRILCDDGRVGVLFLPTGDDAAPTIDPEVVARQATDAMKLAGPRVASPRAAGTYLVGMPMWMWVDPSPATYGPTTATATAGGVTVTATAKVTAVRWAMGDGSTITCTGPGTKYDKSRGKTSSPDCGHRYAQSSTTTQDRGRYRGTATATWTVRWQATGGGGGEFTEARATPFTAAVRELQVLN